MGRAKQNTLWDDEVKRSITSPGPQSYNSTNDKAVKMAKFSGKGIMGYDVKCNQKRIKATPGPGDYMRDLSSSVEVINPISKKVSHNIAFKRGGLKPPEKMSSKETLIALSISQPGRPSTDRTRDSTIKMVGADMQGMKKQGHIDSLMF